MKKTKKLTVTPDLLILGGTLISWLMYSIGKTNGLMMGGEYSILEALIQTFDVFTFAFIAFACITVISIFVKEKGKD